MRLFQENKRVLEWYRKKDKDLNGSNNDRSLLTSTKNRESLNLKNSSDSTKEHNKIANAKQNSATGTENRLFSIKYITNKKK